MTEERDDKLMADASKLATEISPERDLWPEIEMAIQTPARRPGMPWYAQAAAAAALVVGTALITIMLMQPEPPTTSPVVTSTTFDAEFMSFGEDQVLDSSFADARDSVAADLDVALDDLTPEARAEVERNLAVIRNAVAEIKAALEEEPDSELLQELLADAYRQELDLMRKVGGLTRSVMSRNDI